MLWNNIELHNVARLEEMDGVTYIWRFAKEVQDMLDAEANPPYAPAVGRSTTGCEMRFVGEGADLTLTSVEGGDGTVEIWRGDFLCRTERLLSRQPKKLELRSDMRVDQCNLDGYRGTFSTDVWRVIFDHDIRVAINSFEPIGEVRPPRACEVPAKKMISYGSSITHSAGAGFYTNSYIFNTARRLGVDVSCKGMAGSCFIQREMADYIASEDFDVATLELGINMVDSFPVEEYERRVRYIIKTLLPLGKPIVLISNFTSHHCCPDAIFREVEQSYVDTLERLYNEYKTDNLFYIRGRDVIGENYNWLLVDVIHPSPLGHFEMSRIVAEKIKSFNII